MSTSSTALSTDRIVAVDYGGPEVLRLQTAALSEPGPADVVVAVRAAGVNPYDRKQYSGAFGRDAAKLPIALGLEAAGVVEQAGAEARYAGGEPIIVGDEVVVSPAKAAYATRIVAAADAVVRKPAGLGWAEAGGLLSAGGTAADLVETANVGAGDVVLVHGASGGVGFVAAQLAIARGADVIGTASAANHDALREIGVRPVTHGPAMLDEIRALTPSVDAVLDTAGTDAAVDASLVLVTDRSRIVSIAAFGRTSDVLVIDGSTERSRRNRRAAREPLLAAATDGSLRVTIAATLPLAEAARAHGERWPRGKIVLLP